MQKTIKNYIYNLTYQILCVLTPLLTAPYIARVLNPNGVGIYSYTTTVATAFSLFAALGVNLYGQREVAYRQDHLQDRSIVFWELFYIRILTTGIVGICYVWFSLSYTEYTRYLFLQSFLVLATFLDISWFFQGIEDFKIICLRNIVIKLVTVALIFILVRREGDLGKYILINSFSIFASNIIFFVNLKKSIVWIPLKLLNFKRHIRGIVDFFIPLIATQLYSQLDKIMLGVITNDTYENGYYEQARKIINIVIIVITSINTVMYPRISNLYAKGEKQRIRQMYQITFKMIAMLLIPVGIGLWFVSDNFVLWFLGSDYSPVSMLVKLSVFLLVFMAIGNFVGVQYLSPTGKQNQMTVVYLIAALINLILNLILIGSFLSVGALIASIAAEAFSCFAQIWLMQRSEYKFNMLSGLWKYLAAGIGMGAGLFVLQAKSPFTGITQTVVEVVVGAMLYGILLLFEREENLLLLLKKVRERNIKNESY